MGFLGNKLSTNVYLIKGDCSILAEKLQVVVILLSSDTIFVEALDKVLCNIRIPET